MERFFGGMSERLAELAMKSCGRLLGRFTTVVFWRANCPMGSYCGESEPRLY
jgi:hypothetical protein